MANPKISANTPASIATKQEPDGKASLLPSHAAIGQLRLTTDGRIIDFLNPSSSRPNTPEERVRQNYGRRLHFEYGYPRDTMVFEAPIQIGSEKKQADIVVYRTKVAAATRDQAAIRLIVEAKAPDIKKGAAQLQSYIFASSSEGGVWINSTDAPRYFCRFDKPQPHLDDWPNIPRFGEAWEGVGKHKKANLRAPHDLVETFRRCHNALYRVGIDSEDLAMDMVRMILAKYRDEANEGDTCEFRCTPLELQSPRGRQAVAKRVRDLFVQVRDDHPSIFDKHESITAGDREIATVVAELQDFRFLPEEDSDEVYDIVGAAYEVYVGSHLKGDRGQYFTPRLIVQLVTRLVAPAESDIILDPAMGSGGFLIAAMRFVTQAINASTRRPAAKRNAIKSIRNRLYGVDKSPKLVKVARTNMILANDGHAGIVHGDSLEPVDRLPEQFRLRASDGQPTVILTNPPFGATYEHRLTADRHPEILARFKLGHTWRKDPTTGAFLPTGDLSGEGVPPEHLFIERCIRWLAPNGKLGIVVPRGVLDNERALSIRTLLLRETRVLAVVNCHDDTFKPHTDAKAAIIVCQKKERPSDHDEDYPIFMAISQGIGHTPLGEPIYRMDEKGDILIEDGTAEIDQDTDDIYASWVALREGGQSLSDYYYMHSRGRLVGGLLLNPVRYLPRYSESLRRVIALGEQDGWETKRLGVIADVPSSPRFTRPYADKGVTSGEHIVRFFTGNAVTQTRGENIKYLDLRKAKPFQLRQIEQLYLRRGMILITRSGTVGRVVMATERLDGAVGTEDVIRVFINGDDALRGYVYQFLLSEFGQDQLRQNIYGGIVDHIEAPHVRNVLVPIPKDPAKIKAIGDHVIAAIEAQEQAHDLLDKASHELGGLLADAPKGNA